ncbi:hypothetical protein PSRE111525_22810 [Pseudomonas reidholzensis]
MSKLPRSAATHPNFVDGSCNCDTAYNRPFWMSFTERVG